MKLFLFYSALITTAIAISPSVEANPRIHTPTEVKQVSVGQNVRSFFETGRLRSEDQLLWQNRPPEDIPVRERSQSWQFIIFREGGFSFWMPPGVLSKEDINLNTNLGELNFLTLASDTEDRRYLVGYAASLTEEQKKNPQALLKALESEVVQKQDFKLIESRSINLEEYPGLELEFRGESETITMRVYLGENRVFALGVRYPTDNPTPRQTRAFLNALQLLDS